MGRWRGGLGWVGRWVGSDGLVERGERIVVMVGLGGVYNSFLLSLYHTVTAAAGMLSLGDYC